ncbi:uncharacterized protein [Aegilops tauschii subsp. strangulata]|uniref:uncharacterized protein n=1 Tax=Aegilops tauschii subsp. strangulata TaxID=200361 RepID=UPI00098B854D|nr:uncharacterized protein LOC109772316 [Aegilops tauschii subsp. strangulata]
MAAPSTLRRSPRLQARLQQGRITELPSDLLRCIAQRLPSGQDVASFRLTGRVWRDAVPLGGFAPLLMLPESQDGSATSFYRPSDGKILTANLPDLQGKVVCGSSRGWLALVDEEASVTLLNPFTGATVALPPADNKLGAVCFRKLSMDVDGRWVVHSSPNYNEVRAITLSEMRELLFRDIVLSSQPDSADCVAMAQLASSYSVAFCRVGVDRSWTVLHAELTCRIRSVVHCHGSTFLAIGESLGISICYVAGATPSVTALWRCFSPPEWICPRSYLQVDGKLHLVGTVIENNTRHTRVYMCDVFAGKRMWSRVMDVGNQTLFVSNLFMSGHAGVSIPGLMMNFVYFSEHLDGRQEDPDHKLEISDIANGKPELLTYKKKVQGFSEALCWIQPKPNLWRQDYLTPVCHVLMFIITGIEKREDMLMNERFKIEQWKSSTF